MTTVEAAEKDKPLQPLRIIFMLVLIGFGLLRVNRPELLISTVCGIPATIVLGNVLLWQAIRDLRRRWYVYQHGLQTTARVKKIKARGRIQYAVVEFELPDNSKRLVEIKQNIGLDLGIVLPAFTGETDIVIRYDPTNTTEAYIYSSASIWLGPIMGIVLAFGAFASCFLL
jgi:hypothetical protein